MLPETMYFVPKVEIAVIGTYAGKRPKYKSQSCQYIQQHLRLSKLNSGDLNDRVLNIGFELSLQKLVNGGSIPLPISYTPSIVGRFILKLAIICNEDAIINIE